MLVFDLETQNLAHEVGGWANVEALRLAVAVSWDERHGCRPWWEAQAGDLLAELRRTELVVGFNVTKFDYRVLSLYGRTTDLAGRTFDLLDEIRAQTGSHKGKSLAALAALNLGESKGLESGAMAVALWRAGDLDALEAYCRQDVELTRRLYETWRNDGLLWVSPQDYVVWPGGGGGKG
jgi:DEAD/DEAH box helicase domain-containing protein